MKTCLLFCENLSELRQPASALRGAESAVIIISYYEHKEINLLKTVEGGKEYYVLPKKDLWNDVRVLRI